MDILDRIVNFGLSEGLFTFSPLGDLDKSCCPNIGLRVIDFDKTKELLAKSYQLSSPKSCDALFFGANKSTMYLIEMKSWQKFLDYEKSRIDANKINEKVASYDFQRKISDSLFLLELIIRTSQFKITNQERAAYEHINKIYVVLIDIDIVQYPLENLGVNLAYLANYSTQNSDIKTEIATTLSEKLALWYSP